MKTVLNMRAVCTGVVLCGLLIACDRQPAIAAGGMLSYEIVTQTRPESVDGFMELFRVAHKTCAFVREGMKLSPPPPLVGLPTDFVTERTTYLGSGSTSLMRHEEFTVSELKPELNCQYTITSSVTERLVKDGQLSQALNYSDGTLEVDPPEPLPPPLRPAGEAYSEPKNVGGVALRCAAPDRGMSKVMPALCMLDGPSGVLLDGEGKPIIGYARSMPIDPWKVAFLTEPVKVRIGPAVDPARLVLSKVD